MELLERTIDTLHAAPREKFFEALYEKAFPAFARFARSMHASLDDAKDIFHDALVIFHEKSADPDFVIKTSAEGYILGIAKHLWIRKFNHDRPKISLNRVESSISLPADYFPEVNEIRLLKFLERSGKKCLELLRKFYYEKTPLKNIASSLGYGSVHSASVQKFKCIGKIRDVIKSKSMDYEDFLF